MPTYSFSFYPEAAGLPYVVKDRAGNEVASGTLPSDDDVILTLNLPWDSYQASTEIESGPYQSTQQFSAAGEVEASSGGVGASETAYFVATGPTLDTSGNQPVTMEADDRHGALPDWVTIVDGVITLGDDAGTCAVAGKAEVSGNFAAATGIPDTGGYIAVAVRLHDADYVSQQAQSPGDGENVQAVTSNIAGGLIFPGECDVVLEVLADEDGSTPIADGVVTPSVAVTVTRLAQSPVLPE